MGLFKNGFSTAHIIAYSMEYLTAYSYAFRKIQKEQFVDCFRVLSLSFPVHTTEVKKAASLWTKIVILYLRWQKQYRQIQFTTMNDQCKETRNNNHHRFCSILMRVGLSIFPLIELCNFYRSEPIHVLIWEFWCLSFSVNIKPTSFYKVQ